MITVEFEDHGQDILEWDIRGGVVVDSRPYQAWLWKGTQVHNTNIKAGDILDITCSLGRMTFKYPVAKVKETDDHGAKYRVEGTGLLPTSGRS